MPNFKHIPSIPSLEQLAECFDKELQNYYEKCIVSVEDCPDLTKSPFNLASPGIGGKTAIADVGGVPNLVPLVRREKIYSFIDIANFVDIGKSCSIIGASAGPFHKIGTNCEMMPNLYLEKEEQSGEYKVTANNSHIARITTDNNYSLQKVPNLEFGLLGNFFISEGKITKVLKIEVEKRISTNGSFTETLQKILREKYQEPISLGGVFLIEKGKANLHIMPDFSEKPLNSNQDVDYWLRFFDFDSPLVCLTTLHSIDPGFSLRMEHTHCFSDHNQGGHYHNDTTPDNVKYVAYLNVAQGIFRYDMC